MEDGEGGFSCLSTSELISILRTSFRASVFDKVEKVLVARERKLKEELDRKEKECAFLRKKKRPSSLGEENAKRFESEHAEGGVEDENWKGREPWAILLEKYYPNMGAGYSSMIKKFKASSEQLDVGIGGVIGEGEAPERCEQIAPAGGTSSRRSKVDQVITLQNKAGVKRKRSSFADSLYEITESKKPQESNIEASTGWKACEEHSLLKPIPEILLLDSDSDNDDASLDDSSSSDSAVDVHPLLRNLK